MKGIFLFVLLMAASSASAEPRIVGVGKVAIHVPTPAGFSELTHAMKPLWVVNRAGVPASSEQLIAFIPEESVPAALTGSVPAVTRHFRLQVGKDGRDLEISRSMFVELKKITRESWEKIPHGLKNDIRAIEKQYSEALSEIGAAQNDVSLEAPVTLAPHYETSDSYHFSIISRLAFDQDGRPASKVGTGTAVLILAKGRILYAYVYGGEKDLEWTRAQAKQWTEAILAANMDTEVTAPTTAPIAAPTGILDKIMRKTTEAAFGGAIVGIVTVILGLVFARLGRLLRYMRRQKDSTD